MTNRAGWALYFVGRGLQLFGLVLVTRAVLTSSARELRAMVALTGVGVVFFLAGCCWRGRTPGAVADARHCGSRATHSRVVAR